MSQIFWSLFNLRSKERWENLSEQSVVQLLRSIPANEIGSWMCTHETMGSWTPVLSVVEFQYELAARTLSVDGSFEIFESSENILAEPVPAPLPQNAEEMAEIVEFKPKSYFESETTDITQFTVTKDHETLLKDGATEGLKGSGFDRRRYPRFQARFRVMIKNQNLTFRTFTADISIGGLAIETAVPPVCIGTTCLLEIANHSYSENIGFQARLLPNRRESKYFSFIKASPESLTRLQSWLSRYEPMKKAQ